MTPPRRRLALAVATFAFAGMTITGCGALSQAVDCNTAAAEVTTIMNEFNTTAASAATDPKALETAGKEAGAKVKTLAGNYDGEVGAALNDLATGLEGIKIDGSDPAGSMESVSKLQGFITKIQQACS
ncbi:MULTISPECIES: hypothetical protein [Nonomuraea]|uniref:Small secreted protein n=1 Tax=Nonomuraea ferruginea TaxID=46174 RepID=A0ABT4T1X9_9ACTN|nr:MULTISPECIES: hypothetical protein [Nonomuraea]MDA0643320.1 hypothetical protein [Nonomuraea ferruginea]TXK38862.1 hypothetical protein FR742_04125 [Nonomuraea sp. C10]